VRIKCDGWRGGSDEVATRLRFRDNGEAEDRVHDARLTISGAFAVQHSSM